MGLVFHNLFFVSSNLAFVLLSSLPNSMIYDKQNADEER